MKKLLLFIFLSVFGLRQQCSADYQISSKRYNPQAGANPYGLIDLDGFGVQEYGYCKLGVPFGSSTTGNFEITTLAKFDRSLEIPLLGSNFLLNSGTTSLNVIPFPNTTVWNTVAGTVTLFPANPTSTPPLLGQNLSLYRYFHFPDTLQDEITKLPIGPGTKKAIVLIHGWNGASTSDAFSSGELASLFTNLKNALSGSGSNWALILYHWERDADTGQDPATVYKTDPQSTVAAAFAAKVNGTETAEISHQHGQHLGELLDSLTSQQIESVQFIAHSAGAWNARAAAKYLLSARSNSPTAPQIKVQITLLDPFVPAAAGMASSLSTDNISQINTWPTANAANLFRLENYYAVGITSGTQEVFTWRANQDINLNIIDPDDGYDWLLPGHLANFLFDHGRPIAFYASTVRYGYDVSRSYPNFVPIPITIDHPSYNLPDAGWQASMFSQEPKVITQPHLDTDSNPTSQLVVQAGDLIRLQAKVSNRGRIISGHGAHTIWQILYAGQATWNTLQDTSAVLFGPDADSSLQYNVPVNFPNGSRIRILVSNAAGIDTSNEVTLILNGQQSNTAPSAPTNLKATPISSSAIALAWIDTAGNETGFRVERQNGNSGGWSVVAANLPINTTTYTDPSLVSSSPYSYRVAAFNAVSPTGAYSNSAQATTLGQSFVTRSLTVQSVNPNSGISVLVDPADRNGANDGYTPFTRVFNNASSVFLSVPSSTAGGKLFSQWQRNGVFFSNSASVTVLLDANYVFSATYVDPPAGGSPGGMVAAPVIAPPGGSFTNAVAVSLTCATPDAQLRYTTDGTQPTINSPAYTGSINVTQGTTVIATAFKPNTNFSATSTANFTISYSQGLPTPVITPNGGTSANPLSVGIVCGVQNAEVYYTFDGSIPQRSNNTAFSPVTVFVNQTTTIKARAFKDGVNPSAVATATFTITNPQNNDNFSNRVRLFGPENSSTGSNVGATSEAGEPRIHRNDYEWTGNPEAWPANHSVWWVWRAPYTGTVTFDTSGAGGFFDSPSNFDTQLGVFTGSSVSSLTSLGGDDDSGYGGFCSKFSFNAVAGTDYNIVVDGGPTGRISLYWKMTTAPPPLAPYTPTNSEPVDGGAGIRHRPALSSLPFRDFNSGDTHAASQWIVRRNSDNAIVFDSGEDPSNKGVIYLPVPLASSMSYSFIVRHKDSSGLWSDYSSPTSFTTRAAEPVTVSVSSPVQNGNVVGATVNVTGSATANFGITEVRWTNDFGMTGTTVPAATWTASQIPIHPNQNAITISVKDDDGNTGTNLVQFNATIPDTTSPSLTVRFPTDGTEFNTILANTYLSGNAADENGISGISWVNNRGGQGTATGAESWAIGPLTLAAGDNLVTVRATDTAGNFTEKTLLIRFTQLTALENWRQLYFNSTANSGLGADGVDADGDGLTNLFEFVAGLIPNDPASHFNLRVEAVPAVAGQRKIIFSPLVAGRTYIVKSKASLAAPTWTPLTSFTTADNGTERTVTDLAATGPKFYTVEITKP